MFWSENQVCVGAPFFWWNEILIAAMCNIVYDIMNLSGKAGYVPLYHTYRSNLQQHS